MASSCIDLLPPLLSWHRGYMVRLASGEVARACREGLARCVSCRAGEMSIAEIRGYVRARASVYIRDELDETICRRQINPGLRHAIAAAAIDQLVVTVLRDVLCGERTAVAKPLAA
jgi:hypothetical protein